MPNRVERLPDDAAVRFWPLVEKTKGCWLWRGTRQPAGYGVVNLGKSKSAAAHRISWMLHNKRASIPRGLFVCHRCDNPPCVRPDHLFLGTLHDNIADMVAKGRQCRGEAREQAKLTSETVVEVAKLRSAGLSQRKIAARFGIARESVRDVERGKSWRHVVGETIPRPLDPTAKLVSTLLSDDRRILLQRIKDGSAQSGQCRIWTGKTDIGGRAILFFRRQAQRVHKLVWCLAGRILDRRGQFIHLCGRENCIEVDHLQPMRSRNG